MSCMHRAYAHAMLSMISRDAAALLSKQPPTTTTTASPPRLAFRSMGFRTGLDSVAWSVVCCRCLRPQVLRGCRCVLLARYTSAGTER